jgi:metal-responsive CopG/Arc/MetJ family transcriptional regulator
MKKILVSLPDKLVKSLDLEAKNRELDRSMLIRNILESHEAEKQ